MNSEHKVVVPVHPEAQIGVRFKFPGLKDAEFSGYFGFKGVNQWELAAVAEDLVLSEILKNALGISSLPPELPDLVIKKVSLLVDSKLNTSLSGRIELNSNAPDKEMKIGDTLFPLGTLEFAFSKFQARVSGSIKVEGNSIVLTDDIRIKEFSFSFGYDSTGQWELSGDVASIIFDREFALEAAYAVSDNRNFFTLSYKDESATPLVQIPDVASLDIDNLKLRIEKEKATAASWEFSATGGLNIAGGTIDFWGDLTLFYRTDGSAGLSFKPVNALVSLPLPEAGAFDLEFGDISIEREGSGAGNGWAFRSSVTLSCAALHDALPEIVQGVFPKSITTRFQADKTAVMLSTDRILNPVDIPLPDIEIDGGQRIELGIIRLDATDLAIHIGKDMAVSAQFSVGMPASLNNVFGVKADGKTPAVKIFKTFDPQDAQNTLIKTKLSVGTDGIKMMLVSSPLEAISLKQDKDKVWWNVDLGDFGAVRFQAPVFSYDVQKGTFEASGGFEVTKPLALPLTPIKALLENAGLQAAANLLPESLPLDDLTILDDDNNFKDDELCDLLNAIIPGEELPIEIEQAVKTFGQYVDKLPDTFREYLNIKMPQSFSFSVAVSPKGSVRFDVRVNEGDPPVKLLYPVPGTLPMLEGIQLYGLSFGLGLGGTIALVQADMRLDEFDLITLASALLLPDDHGLPLPDPHNFQRRLIIDKLYMIIILATRIPIPVPVFYDELGIEYLGLEGVNLQAHIKFPMPTLSLTGIVKVLMSFVKFVSDPKALMDPNALTKEQQLTFSVGHTYLQLPEYLGGAVLGHKGDDLTVDSYTTIAKLMNAAKTRSINDVIQLIPLHYRVGNERVMFGPIELGLTWLLTTPQEFRQTAYQQVAGTPDEAGRFMEVLPAVRSSSAGQGQGVVVFLSGHGAFGDWASFETIFGLAAAGSTGFHTGFKIAGKIIHLIDMELSGCVAINAPDSDVAFQLAGHSHLEILGHQIFEGDIQIAGKGFWFEGNLELFPKGFPIQVSGRLAGSFSNEKLYLAGEVETALLGLTLADARGLITNDGIWVEGTLFGVRTTLEAVQKGDELALHGQVALDLWGWHAFTRIDIDRANGAVLRAEIDPVDIPIFKLSGAGGRSKPSALLHIKKNKIEWMDISADVELLGFRSQTQIRASAAGFSFKTSGIIFNQFESTIEASGSGSIGASFHIKATMRGDLMRTLADGALEIINSAVLQSGKDLQNLINEVNFAKGEVRKLDVVIAEQRKIVQSERDLATQNLRKAQQDVGKAQKEVNKILNVIRYNEGEINRLGSGHWGWFFGIRFWVYDDPLALTKMIGLRTAITAEWIAYGTAFAALEAFKTTLLLAEGAIVITPIDLDVRVSGPLALRETALFGLGEAEDFLEGMKASVGAAANVAKFIASGAGQLLEIHSARFEADLQAIGSGGSVPMALDLTFLGQRKKEALDFNFNNPLESVQALGRLLLSY